MRKAHKHVVAGILVLSSAILASSPFALAAAERAEEKESVFTLEEIVVTSHRMAQPLVIETDPKAPRQPVPAADGGGYLKNIPGFSGVRQGGTGSDPLLRGLGGTRLNVLLDGTAQLGGCPSRMDPTTSYAFPEAFSKIIVLKGPESVRYGGGNVAGTVLFERETAPFDKADVRVNSSVLVGSAGRNDELLDVTAGDTSGYVRIIKTRSHADNYEDGAGNKIHSFYTRQSLSGIVGVTPDANTLYEFAVDSSTAEAAYGSRGMDGPQFDQRNYSFKYEKKHLSTLVSNLEFKAYHNYVDHVMDNFTFRNPGMMGPMVSNVDRTTTGGRLAAKLSLSTATEANVGFDYQKNEHTKRGMGTEYKSLKRNRDLTFTNYGLFGDVKRTLDSHNRLMAGIRADSLEVKKLTSVTAEDKDHTYGAFLRYEHDYANNPLTSYIGLGHAQRPADYWERNKGANNSTFFLKPEKNTQLDTGILYNAGKFQASLSVFYADIKDFILLTGASSANNIDATLFGGEADAAYRLADHWTATATLAYVRGTNETGSKPLSQIPPLEATIGLKYNRDKLEVGLLWRGVQAQTRYDIGSGSEVGLDIGRSSGFGILSMNGAYRPSRNIVIAAGVDNLFNKNYAEFVSREGKAVDGIPASVRLNEPGRTIWVKTSYNF